MERIEALRTLLTRLPPYRYTCYFCARRWGQCKCVWTTDGFIYQNTLITEPNVSECGRFYVTPHRYYGDAYVVWSKRQRRG